jgi:hypothetical protein
VNIENRRTAWACCIVVLVLTTTLAGQALPTAKPEDVGVSSAKVDELSKFMQSLVDQGKIAGGVTMMARHDDKVENELVVFRDERGDQPDRHVQSREGKDARFGRG